MNEQEAIKILNSISDTPTIQKDGISLFNLSRYLVWSPGDRRISLDDDFTVEELQAIAWWVSSRKGYAKY